MKSIAKIVGAIQEVALSKEIIIVDDASTDNTVNVIEKEILPGSSHIKLIRHTQNQGKGTAIRTALAYVTGEIVIIQDADLEYSPSQYPQLIEPILQGKTQVVYGSRFRYVNKWLFVWHWFSNRFLGRHYEIRYLHHFIGIQILNILANILYDAKITDEATCYKVIKTSVLKDLKLRCKGFEFCPEVTAKLRKKGHRIYEVPITYHPRTKNEGKKLNWKHGFEAIWTLIKYRFTD